MKSIEDRYALVVATFYEFPQMLHTNMRKNMRKTRQKPDKLKRCFQSESRESH